MDTALLIADVQNDFCTGGSLGVEGGEEVAVPLSRLAHALAEAGGPVFAARDWHPAESAHFQQGGGRWPPHCIQGTPGADFHPDLDLPEAAVVVSKGMDPASDAYSAFQAEDAQGTSLPDRLRQAGVRTLHVGGLTTEYCVRTTVLDALREGFRVSVLLDAVRAVDPAEGERALEEMRRAGATTCTTAEALRRLAREGSITLEPPPGIPP